MLIILKLCSDNTVGGTFGVTSHSVIRSVCAVFSVAVVKISCKSFCFRVDLSRSVVHNAVTVRELHDRLKVY